MKKVLCKALKDIRYTDEGSKKVATGETFHCPDDGQLRDLLGFQAVVRVDEAGSHLTDDFTPAPKKPAKKSVKKEDKTATGGSGGSGGSGGGDDGGSGAGENGEDDSVCPFNEWLKDNEGGTAEDFMETQEGRLAFDEWQDNNEGDVAAFIATFKTPEETGYVSPDQVT